MLSKISESRSIRSALIDWRVSQLGVGRTLAERARSRYGGVVRFRELRELLLRHEPADAREAGHRARMLALLDADSPFDRGSFQPGHFTASAFVQSADGRSLLLIHHKKLGIWVQPGGHIDPEDASIAAAAFREAAEETGVFGVAPGNGEEFPIFDIDVHPIPARKGEPAHEHFDVRFAFRALEGGLSPSEEVTAVRWVPLRDVASVTGDESVLRAVRKLLGSR